MDYGVKLINKIIVFSLILNSSKTPVATERVSGAQTAQVRGQERGEGWGHSPHLADIRENSGEWAPDIGKRVENKGTL